MQSIRSALELKTVKAVKLLQSRGPCKTALKRFDIDFQADELANNTVHSISKIRVFLVSFSNHTNPIARRSRQLTTLQWWNPTFSTHQFVFFHTIQYTMEFISRPWRIPHYHRKLSYFYWNHTGTFFTSEMLTLKENLIDKVDSKRSYKAARKSRRRQKLKRSFGTAFFNLFGQLQKCLVVTINLKCYASFGFIWIQNRLPNLSLKMSSYKTNIIVVGHSVIAFTLQKVAETVKLSNLYV